jgi:hypothetical protein
LLFGLVVAVPQAHGAKIGDIGEFSLTEQIIRFFSLKDTAVRYALIGSLLLGITS